MSTKSWAVQTDAAVDLTAFYFESDLLRLSAVEKASNRSLRTLVPLVTPGVAPIRIRAKEKFVREFDLGSIFPDLESVLTRSAVGVSWRLKLDPGPGCFSEVSRPASLSLRMLRRPDLESNIYCLRTMAYWYDAPRHRTGVSTRRRVGG